jgi:hypothetical protein
MEDAEHLLFQCPIFVWTFACDALEWDRYPRSIEDLILNWLPQKFGVNSQIGLFCFAGLARALWITRNQICMQEKLTGKPIDVIYSCISFVQRWRILLKENQRKMIEALVDGAMEGNGASRKLQTAG